MTAPWAPLMTVMPTGMRNRATARTAARPRLTREHQCVLSLTTPMSTKKATRGARPTRAVR